MTQDANLRLTGKQMRLVEEGLRSAFVDYNDLARLVLYDPPSGHAHLAGGRGGGRSAGPAATGATGGRLVF
jgi:hypothetical protein